MAVYTHLSDHYITTLVRQAYGMEVAQVKPVAEGIENSIYRLDCGRETQSVRPYAFVIFETLEHELVEAYCAVFERISIALKKKMPQDSVQIPGGIKLQAAYMTSSGNKNSHQNVFTLEISDGKDKTCENLKPAVLQPWIEGWHRSTTPALCHELGRVLGVINSISPPENAGKSADKGIPFHQHLRRIQAVEDCLNDYPVAVQQQFHVYKAELADIINKQNQLSLGLIHGDLFLDNSLMNEDGLTGIIDFFNASWSPKLMDLAICLMDWCAVDNDFDPVLTKALIQGFRENCELVPSFDLSHWTELVRLAAFRFWCTRQEYYFACQQRGITPVENRDPAFCENIFLKVKTRNKFLNSLWD